jgi:hypothetical protein
MLSRLNDQSEWHMPRRVRKAINVELAAEFWKWIEAILVSFFIAQRFAPQ